MTKEPAGKTGMAAAAENCLLLIAQAEEKAVLFRDAVEAPPIIGRAGI